VAEFVGAQAPPMVSTFFDELLAPPLLDRALEGLRASGALPEVLQALEAGDEQRALDLVFAEIAGADAERRELLRELAVAIFDHLGHDDPVTVSYRRRLATTLY
jgi:hypothetical protein